MPREYKRFIFLNVVLLSRKKEKDPSGFSGFQWLFELRPPYSQHTTCRRLSLLDSGNWMTKSFCSSIDEALEVYWFSSRIHFAVPRTNHVVAQCPLRQFYFQHPFQTDYSVTDDHTLNALLYLIIFLLFFKVLTASWEFDVQ